MANHDISWVLGTHMRFGSLDFIITMEGELAWAHAPIQLLCSISLDVHVKALKKLQLHAPESHVLGSDHLLGFDYGRLEHQLDAFLGPRPSREDVRCLTFSFTNVMTQLARGEPLSPEYFTRDAPTTLSFGLCNATRTIGHLTVQCMYPPPMDDEFMGMADYVMESFHDLLIGDSESISDSDSSRGVHHPS